jgi:Cd2+/Zn2+-exporting ATPase
MKVIMSGNPANLCSRIVVGLFQAEPGVHSVEINRSNRAVTLGYDENILSADRAQELTRIASEKIAQNLLACREQPETCSDCLRDLQAPRLGLVTLLRINPDNGNLGIHRKGCRHGKALRWWREKWPQFKNREISPGHDPEEWKGMLRLALACGAFTLAGWSLEKFAALPWYGAWAAYAAAYAAGGWDAAQDVWDLLRKRCIDIHFLMLVVAAGAACVGAPLEGALLLFLFSLGGALEHFAQGRTQKEIQALLKTAPREACRLRDGREEQVPIDDLLPGDLLRIRPGDILPADGVVEEGRSAVDESMLTGESVPVDKPPGSRVLSGTLNQTGTLTLRVAKTPRDSTLQKILNLIQNAQQQKAPAQRFTDRFNEGYTWLVLAGSLALFLGNMFLRQQPLSAAFYQAMTLLVVASPCALVLSIPSAILAAIACGARQGILFRGGAAIELLAQVDTVAIDKTGTLTTGQFAVTQIEPLSPQWDKQEILRRAASLEAFSEHLLARAIVEKARQWPLALDPVENFQAHAGRGVSGQMDGRRFALGTPSFLAEEFPGLSFPESPGHGKSEAWISDGQRLGRLLAGDEIRDQAPQSIQNLQQRRRVIMLTGDHENAAAAAAQTLGIREFYARLLPEQKLEKIRSLQKEGRKVAMVGDGVNDAPSLVAADVGIAMGAHGSDAALEQADVILMNDRLERLSSAFRLSSRAAAVIRQNLVISLGTVVVLVGLALTGNVNLTWGVVGHEGSTVVVVLNSLRLLFKR